MQGWVERASPGWDAAKVDIPDLSRGMRTVAEEKFKRKKERKKWGEEETERERKR